MDVEEMMAKLNEPATAGEMLEDRLDDMANIFRDDDDAAVGGGTQERRRLHQGALDAMSPEEAWNTSAVTAPRSWRAAYRAKKRREELIAVRRETEYVSRVRREFPGIGEALEEIARDSQVGADRWRRTGMLTLEQGGGEGSGKRLTFTRAHQLLVARYGNELSLCSVKRLCQARNVRTRNSGWYLGLAEIVSRRAVKGFALKLNIDDHWSNAFYKG